MNIRANGLTQKKSHNTKTTRAEICFNKILSVHFPLNSIYKAILPSFFARSQLACILSRSICITTTTHRRLKRIVAAKQTTFPGVTADKTTAQE